MKIAVGIAVLGVVLAGCGGGTRPAPPVMTSLPTPTTSVVAATTAASSTVAQTTTSSTVSQATTLPSERTTTSPASSDPTGVVQAYFRAINNRDFQRAWDLGGHNLDSSYAKFVSGFATTDRDDLTILSATDSTVSVQLVATNTDSSQKQFQGTYTATNGVITAANLHAVSTASQPPATTDASVKTVLYEASSASGQASSVTYFSADNSLRQETDKKLPWSKTVVNDSTYVTTGLTVQNGGTGSITCRITVDGKVADERTAKGQYAVVSCTGPVG